MQNESPGRTIQATALVHEAYLRLIDVTNVDWQHRAHFFAVSARIMRNILLDTARARSAAKRGGNQPRVNLDEIPDVSGQGGRDLIALDDALNALAAIDPRRARVIELRFFGGLSVEETAEVLNVAPDNRHARCQTRTSLAEARVERQTLMRQLCQAMTRLPWMEAAARVPNGKLYNIAGGSSGCSHGSSGKCRARVLGQAILPADRIGVTVASVAETGTKRDETRSS